MPWRGWGVRLGPSESPLLRRAGACLWELPLGTDLVTRGSQGHVFIGRSHNPCCRLYPAPGSYSVPPLILGSGHSGESGRVRGFTALSTNEAPFGARAIVTSCNPQDAHLQESQRDSTTCLRSHSQLVPALGREHSLA